ncbi:ABC transporter ATP-binding protein [Rhodobacteraceae bacterium KMS-5]|uniref:ABC transporter ATP-binding protein n=2 Tax=Tabrizicola oligotrophica TaxID=2710650 RepID=A0A6M0QRT2_9RHOB|nr:ABC transporter ATP-binding protein [Tabrizicola oligotrophica]
MIALAFLLLLIEGATLGALSKAIEPLFDQVFAKGDQAALWPVGLAILGLFVIRGLATIASRTVISAVTQKVAALMQSALLRHLLTLEGRFFQDNPPGALIERVQGDTLAVQGIWSALVTGIGRDLFSLVFLFVVALSIDPVWTIAALVGAPLLILPSVLVQRYIRKKVVQLRNQAGLRATRLDEIFHGIQAVKLNRMEAYQADRFDRVLGLMRRAEIKISAGRALMPGMMDFVTGFGFFAVLLMAGGQIAGGARSTGEFMAFFTAMSLTFQPMRRLGDLSGSWQVASASLERIYRLLDTAPAQTRPARSATLPAPGAPEIRFQDVTFAHGDQPVLRGLSFTARAGQTTAIVGASGAGKSTVFQLLTGLLDPASGQILIGGIDTAALALPDQRRLFASVTQDAALFDETLRENVELGRPLDDAALKAALAMAHVTDFLPNLPLGVDTPVGPRGSALSGGQKQRVAIARALAQDAPVLLLDEATSALDAGSEAAIAAALARAAQGRTTLVIAHRLATVREADHILVMDQGRVVEEGPHAALLAQGGIYARLYQLQFKG